MRVSIYTHICQLITRFKFHCAVDRCMADGTSLDHPVIRPRAGCRWHVWVATLILCLAFPELCVELCPRMAIMGHVAGALCAFTFSSCTFLVYQWWP